MRKNYLPWVGAVLALIAVVSLGAYAATHPVKPAGADSATPLPIPTGVVSEPNAPGVPDGMRSYTNAKYHFSLFYPQELIQTEYQESNGAVTATFKNQDGTNGGFQIYVTPYTDTQITPARFKLDEPSGVKQVETPIVVDGTPATMFFSTNAAMGDTREVWFIKNGFLYEVTTYKELDTWLAGIMATWKFI